MGEDSGSDAPWSIVSIKAQDVDEELPMQPITMCATPSAPPGAAQRASTRTGAARHERPRCAAPPIRRDLPRRGRAAFYLGARAPASESAWRRRPPLGSPPSGAFARRSRAAGLAFA